VRDGDCIVDFIPKKWSIRDIAIPSDLIALLQQHRAKSESNLCFPTRTGRVKGKLGGPTLDEIWHARRTGTSMPRPKN